MQPARDHSWWTLQLWARSRSGISFERSPWWTPIGQNSLRADPITGERLPPSGKSGWPDYPRYMCKVLRHFGAVSISTWCELQQNCPVVVTFLCVFNEMWQYLTIESIGIFAIVVFVAKILKEAWDILYSCYLGRAMGHALKPRELGKWAGKCLFIDSLL